MHLIPRSFIVHTSMVSLIQDSPNLPQIYSTINRESFTMCITPRPACPQPPAHVSPRADRATDDLHTLILHSSTLWGFHVAYPPHFAACPTHTAAAAAAPHCARGFPRGRHSHVAHTSWCWCTWCLCARAHSWTRCVRGTSQWCRSQLWSRSWQRTACWAGCWASGTRRCVQYKSPPWPGVLWA